MSTLPNYNPEDYKYDTELDLNPYNYPNFGCYHMVEKPLKQLAQLHIRRLAALSDAITRKYALNPIFQKMQLEALDWSFSNLDRANATSLGNTAFMALHNPGTPYEDYYKKVIIRLK